MRTEKSSNRNYERKNSKKSDSQNDFNKDNSSDSKPKRKPIRKDSDKKEFGKKDFRKKDSDKKEFGKKDFRKKDSDKKEFGKKDFRKKDSDKKEFGKKDFRKKDSDKKEFGKKDFRKKDSDKKEFGKKDFRKKDSDKKEFGKKDFKKKDFDKKEYGNKDFKKKDFDKKEYGNKDFKKKDFDKKEYGNKDFKKKDFDKKEYGNKDFKKKDFDKKEYGNKDFKKKDFDKKEHGNKDFKKKDFDKKEYGNKDFKKKDFDKKEYGNKDFKKKDNYKESKKSNQKIDQSEDTEMRLNRYIANSGLCSRRKADEYIQEGLITVNDIVITELGTVIKKSDIVKFKGKILADEKRVYILMNKPKDYITSSDDPEDRRIVLDLLKNEVSERVYPVGRLDRNTTGVLLLTNDGDLTTRLTHPSANIPKLYVVTLDNEISHDEMKQLAEGIELEDGYINADSIYYYSNTQKDKVVVEIHSGRNRIVRRMFEHIGYRVKNLDRIEFAGIVKRDLKRGEWRYLSEKEIGWLKMAAGNVRIEEQTEEE